MKRFQVTTTNNAFIFGFGANREDAHYYGLHIILGFIVIRIQWKKYD